MRRILRLGRKAEKLMSMAGQAATPEEHAELEKAPSLTGEQFKLPETLLSTLTR